MFFMCASDVASCGESHSRVKKMIVDLDLRRVVRGTFLFVGESL